jgi:hypothetical protein
MLSISGEPMNNTSEAANITEASARMSDVPSHILALILRDHLGDPTAVITDCVSTLFPHQGTNDSTTFWRVTLSWTVAKPSPGPHTATWIMKHWQAGGARDRTLGINQPREGLAWEQGWLRPAALPAGLVVPMIGAWRSPDNTEAWLAMVDVSPELSAYARLSLSAAQAVERAQTILTRLAHFHARWEQPAGQAELQTCSWLRCPEQYLWEMAPTYAHALGRPPVAHLPQGITGPLMWEGLSADLNAFLEGRPVAEQRLWEQLLIDRQALVDGLAPYPQTLLHNDLDDRNIGLRWSDDVAATHSPTPDSPDLILIDWEWMGVGPAALDVARMVAFLPIMITPGASIPEVVWSDAFADHYFAHYRAAGGRCDDATAWRRSYGLARLRKG